MAEGDSELQDLYRDALLDYFHSGAHKGTLDPADVRAHGINPVCGDEIELTMTLSADGRIAKVRFSGHGCVISQASTAMMAEIVERKTMDRATELVTAFKDMMLSRAPLDSLPEELEAAKALEGVRRFPTRIKCATLAWNTFLRGLAAETSGKSGPEAEFEEA